ncbi:2-nitropropane dioxygenase [Aspergillus filifer]
MSLTTPVTRLLGCEHPILLAGMGNTSKAPLVAAVSNAGGLGVIGGVRYTPAMLRELLAEVKELLRDPSLPFGVDLLLPKIGGSARKTNRDYTKGQLHELIDIIIENGAKLFVAAVGLPPRDVVDKLHAAGVLYMNMVGHPKHAIRACENGADIICAQGGEAGGHTGDIPTSILVPACADICQRYKSNFTGQPVQLIAAGGMADGRSLAAALSLGAGAIWVGTRFVASKESSAPQIAKDQIINATFDSTIRSTFWSGRPLRALKTPLVADWEANRAEEMRSLQSRSIVVMEHELDRMHDNGTLTEELEEQATLRPMGIVAGLINKPNQPAKEIVEEMVQGAVEVLSKVHKLIGKRANL